MTLEGIQDHSPAQFWTVPKPEALLLSIGRDGLPVTIGSEAPGVRTVWVSFPPTGCRVLSPSEREALARARDSGVTVAGGSQLGVWIEAP
jgi:hypothetical protein